MKKAASGRVEVGLDSFDRGLVTIVPSEQAGKISGVIPGSNPNPQAVTLQYGPDLKKAVVAASNVRFENGAALSAPGYEQIAVTTPAEELIGIMESQQVGSNIPGRGKFLFVCTSAGIYLAVPA